ncbi:hypothetical protein [Streptomyces sp. NPDC058964]|uniref:hypothetical protein n=1 Tax=Streptomyces sp. NPDC058964 TaxID=3346681 RepID=UPI0036A786E6
MTMRTRRVPVAVLLAAAALAATAAPALAAGKDKGASEGPVAHLVTQVGGALVECAVDNGLKDCRRMNVRP